MQSQYETKMSILKLGTSLLSRFDPLRPKLLWNIFVFAEILYSKNMEASLVLHENEVVIYRGKRETVITSVFIISTIFLLGYLFLYLGQRNSTPWLQGTGIGLILLSGVGVLVLYRVIDYLKTHPGLPLIKLSSDRLSLNLVISIGVSSYDWTQIDRLVIADSVLYSDLDGHSNTTNCVVVFFKNKKVSNFIFEGWRHHRSKTKHGHSFTLVTFPTHLTATELKAKVIRFVPGFVPVEVENQIVLD